MVVTVWAMIAAALLMALPRITSDIRADREATVAAPQAIPDADPPSAPAPSGAPDVVATVSTPGVGSRERTAIFDALRQRLKSSSRFRVDHIRVAAGWAFVRATEVVTLDNDEQQETDLTVAALLEFPAGSTTGWWRIAELWTLPGEDEHRLAEFVRRVRTRLRAERLPEALLPDDL